MGVKDSWKFSVPSVKTKLLSHFATEKCTKIEIDISIALHPAYKDPKIAFLVSSTPPFPYMS